MRTRYDKVRMDLLYDPTTQHNELLVHCEVIHTQQDRMV